MAEVTPPLFQTIDGEYTGASLGLPYRDLVLEGVLGNGDLAVTQRAAGANMSVDVAPGVAWIKGDDSDLQPTYRCMSDSVVNLAIAAAHGSQDRIDRVVAEVRDASFSGVSTDWRLRVITGTPAGSPSAPAEPSSAITLALVSVPATDTSIENAQISNYRQSATMGSRLVRRGQRTTNQSVGVITEATSVVVGASAAPLYCDGVSRYLFEFDSPAAEANVGAANLFILLHDGTVSRGIFGRWVLSNGDAKPVNASMTLVPAAGLYTFSARAFVAVSNVTLVGGTGGAGAYVPAEFRVTRLGLSV